MTSSDAGCDDDDESCARIVCGGIDVSFCFTDASMSYTLIVAVWRCAGRIVSRGREAVLLTNSDGGVEREAEGSRCERLTEKGGTQIMYNHQININRTRHGLGNGGLSYQMTGSDSPEAGCLLWFPRPKSQHKNGNKNYYCTDYPQNTPLISCPPNAMMQTPLWSRFSNLISDLCKSKYPSPSN